MYTLRHHIAFANQFRLSWMVHDSLTSIYTPTSYPILLRPVEWTRFRAGFSRKTNRIAFVIAFISTNLTSP